MVCMTWVMKNGSPNKAQNDFSWLDARATKEYKNEDAIFNPYQFIHARRFLNESVCSTSNENIDLCYLFTFHNGPVMAYCTLPISCNSLNLCICCTQMGSSTKLIFTLLTSSIDLYCVLLYWSNTYNNNNNMNL